MLMESELSRRAGAAAEAATEQAAGKAAWFAAMGNEFKAPFISLH
jgi:hypothetical protein